MLTLSQINKELKKRGIKEELVRGKGYFYFTGGEAHTWVGTSIYVYNVRDLTMQMVLDEYETLSADKAGGGYHAAVAPYAPDWERSCWLVALERCTKAKEPKILKLMKKNGWAGGFEAQTKVVILTLWDILGHKPVFIGRNELGPDMTAAKFSSLHPKGKGLVFNKEHVMPYFDGKVYNLNGYGDHTVDLIVPSEGMPL